jgi:hypothetical protein
MKVKGKVNKLMLLAGLVVFLGFSGSQLATAQEGTTTKGAPSTWSSWCHGPNSSYCTYIVYVQVTCPGGQKSNCYSQTLSYPYVEPCYIGFTGFPTCATDPAGF